jgi:hypothetical protein
VTALALRVALTLAFAPPVTASAQAVPPSAAAPQQREAAAGVAVDTIRVGDAVPVAVRVAIGSGERVVWPDTLPLGETEAENAASVRARVDTLADGRLEAEAVYSVTPWRTGEVPLPDLAVGVVGGDETVRTRSVSLPVLNVLSVLPADTAGLQPKPAKGVVGRSWAVLPIVLAALAVLAVLGGLVWWLRRRRPAEAPDEGPTISPRERALARLDAALDAGLIDRGAMKTFYTRVSHAVRGYLADLDPDWGDDLTTTEVLGRFRKQVTATGAVALAELLRPADQVKFARREPDASTARMEWQRARDWVESFDWPPAPAPVAEEAA